MPGPRPADAVEFRLRGSGVIRRQCLAPRPSVDFDDRRAERGSGLDLLGLGCDEQRHADAGSGQLPHHVGQCGALPGSIEAAFGRALRPPFRNDAGGVRLHLRGNGDHFRGGSHFQIKRLFDAHFEAGDIVVDNVAAVLAQVRRDAVSAGRNCDFGGPHRIGMAAAARVAHRGDMVDVDAEADPGRRSWHVRRRG